MNLYRTGQRNFRARALLPRVLLAPLLALLTVGNGLAQDLPPEDEPPSAREQEVDREEAEFRRRMELEEGDEGDARAPLPLPDVIDVEPEPGPMDHLPAASREHLEDQLTGLIIENGRWTPADAQREAPYEPSEAAAADPQLAAEEAEVWAEMVEAYNEREAEAYARQQPGGQAQGSGAGDGDGNANGSGQGAGSGQGSGNGSGQGADGAPVAGGVAGEPVERAPQDSTFSALEFLEGQQPAGVASGEPPADPGNDTGTPEDAGPVSDGPPPGGQEPSRDEGQDGQVPSAQPANADVPPQGIPLDALQGLFGEGPAGEGREKGQAPNLEQGADPAPGQDGQEADSDPDAQPATPQPPVSPPPPENPFLAWLRGLFGG